MLEVSISKAWCPHVIAQFVSGQFAFVSRWLSVGDDGMAACADVRPLGLECARALRTSKTSQSFMQLLAGFPDHFRHVSVRRPVSHYANPGPSPDGLIASC